MKPMKKRILTAVVTVCMLFGSLSALSSCSRAPAVEEVYDRVVELIEASYELNTLFYGAGLPVYERGSTYAEFTYMYFDFAQGANYEVVSDFTKFASEAEIKQAAERVYSTAYLEDVLYPNAFDGYAIDDGKGNSAYAFARFLDEGGWIYQSVHNENYLKDGMRVYDYSTMKIVSPSKADAIYVSIDSWLPSNPSVISNDPIRLVLQDDGQWYLDSFTG